MKKIIIMFMFISLFNQLYLYSNDPVTVNFRPVGVIMCDDIGYNMELQKEYIIIFGIFSIKNNTDSTISLWTMTCSWTDYIHVDPDSILIFIPSCDSNSPWPYELENGESLEYNTLVHIPKEYYLSVRYKGGYIDSTKEPISYDTFKIGWSVIYKNEIEHWAINQNYDKEMREAKNDTNKIVWTKPVEIRNYNYWYNIIKNE